jgi:hypothetical protein
MGVNSNQTRGMRLVGTFPITQDGQQLNIDLPRGPHLEACFVRISGTINITTAFTTLRANGPWAFLRRLDWVLNSNVTLDSVSGLQLLALQQVRRALPPGLNPAVGVGVTSFSATFPVDRVLMDMVRSKDSMLKTDVGISNNQLRLQLGALSEMFTGAGVATYTNVTASVFVIDYQEERVNGDTPKPMYYIKRNGFRTALPSAGAGQQIKINTGNRLRILSGRQLVAATGEPDATNSLVTRVKIQRAGDLRIDMAIADLVALNTVTYGIAPLTGQFTIDFANTGQLNVKYSEFWPIPSSADTFLVVDTSTTSILDVATIEGVDLPQ